MKTPGASARGFHLTEFANRCINSFRCKAFVVAIALTASGMCYAQIPAKTKTIQKIFPVDKTFSCIKTWSETATVLGEKITERNKIYQVFKDKRTKAELFRVEIGDAMSTWWNYGISSEGDFNGDGVQDIAWYGGDDTSDVMYAFLSSKRGFRRVDIYNSFQHKWVRTFHEAAPEFRDIDREYLLENVRFARDATGLSLLADVRSTDHPGKGPHRLHVTSSNLIFD